MATFSIDLKLVVSMDWFEMEWGFREILTLKYQSGKW